MYVARREESICLWPQINIKLSFGNVALGTELFMGPFHARYCDAQKVSQEGSSVWDQLCSLGLKGLDVVEDLLPDSLVPDVMAVAKMRREMASCPPSKLGAWRRLADRQVASRPQHMFSQRLGSRKIQKTAIPCHAACHPDRHGTLRPTVVVWGLAEQLVEDPFNPFLPGWSRVMIL